MDGLCRICSGDLTTEKRSRPKTSVSDQVIRDFGIDFSQDKVSWPSRIHNSCFLKIKANKDYLVVSFEEGDEGRGEESDGHDGKVMMKVMIVNGVKYPVYYVPFPLKGG